MIRAARDSASRWQSALKYYPDHFVVWNNLGCALLHSGDVGGAITSFRKALALNPGADAAAANLLRSMNFDAGCDAASMLALAREVNAPLQFDKPKFPNSRDPERPLRLAYLSDGFRAHAISLFFTGTLAAHNRDHFRVYCYSTASQQDEVSQNIAASCDGWRDVRGVAPGQVARLMQDDGIDIVIERGGFVSETPRSLLAMQLAPLQISSSDYPSTMALPSVAYKLTDAVLDPPGSERFYTEELVRLPTALCFTPPAYAPRIAPLPALKARLVTFAAFHRREKMSSESIELWAAVLRAIPDSRLLLHHVFAGAARVSRAFRRPVDEQFERLGVSAERLHWVGARSHRDTMRLYSKCDLALDAYPFSGATTTCEALWMGVPVVTWPAGDRAVSRVSASYLTAAGLSRFVAASANDFVAIASEAVRDLPRLSELRQGLRAHILSSALADAARHTAALESTLRGLWRKWCWA